MSLQLQLNCATKRHVFGIAHHPCCAYILLYHDNVTPTSPCNHIFWTVGISYTLISFLPQYLEQRFNMDLSDAGGLAVLPYLIQILTGIVGGWWTDRLIGRGHSVRAVRGGISLFANMFPVRPSCAQIPTCISLLFNPSSLWTNFYFSPPTFEPPCVATCYRLCL